MDMSISKMRFNVCRIDRRARWKKDRQPLCTCAAMGRARRMNWIKICCLAGLLVAGPAHAITDAVGVVTPAEAEVMNELGNEAIEPSAGLAALLNYNLSGKGALKNLSPEVFLGVRKDFHAWRGFLGKTNRRDAGKTFLRLTSGPAVSGGANGDSPQAFWSSLATPPNLGMQLLGELQYQSETARKDAFTLTVPRMAVFIGFLNGREDTTIVQTGAMFGVGALWKGFL